MLSDLEAVITCHTGSVAVLSGLYTHMHTFCLLATKGRVQNKAQRQIEIKVAPTGSQV